jgi:hypothetical protein
MSDACRSCQAPVLWARSPKGDKPWLPLDESRVPWGTPGALVLVDGWAYSQPALIAAITRKRNVSANFAEASAKITYGCHVSHFATCPNAAAHRRHR